MTQFAPDDVIAGWSERGPDREPLIVVEPLLEFLDERGLGAGPAEFEPIGDGHSNITCLVTRSELRLVLRRPPRGPLPPSAHDVIREARIMSAIAGDVPAPAVLATCDDATVIGAPFVVMEHVAGVVVDDTVPRAFDTPGGRHQVALELVDSLVRIHAFDWASSELADLAKPGGYLPRQLRRFAGLWDINRTREIPEIEAVAAWLSSTMPESQATTLVHGDYRLGNVMFDATAPVRLKAVLDWEMATLGDPLADLAYLTVMWADRATPAGGLDDLSPVTRAEGFPTGDELAGLYAEGSGRPVADLRWYQVLALYKAAVFMEGNVRRALAGSSDDQYARGFAGGVELLAQRARELTLRKGQGS